MIKYERSNLKYHFKPTKGWINDPNGLVYYQGWYHAFFQHAPDYEKPFVQPMTWGHARTKDFINWEELPLAIYPTTDYDKKGCWSGTATVKDGVLYLIYSSITAENFQTVSVAYSRDGVTFEKYAKNPVIITAPPTGSKKDFRDPAVCKTDNGYLCVMATGHEESATARLLVYESQDLLNWRYLTVAAEWQDCACAECPSLVPYEKGYLLSTSILPHGKEHFFSLNYCDYVEGKLNIKQSARLFMGPDEYAGQIFKDERGRCIIISWVSGWSYSNFKESCIGCLSLPCEITVENGKIYAYPVEEVRHLLKDGDEVVKITRDGFLVEREGRTPVEFVGKITDLKILKDEYVVEIFVNKGEFVYTVIL